MALKEYTVRSNENEKVKRILGRLSEVKIIGDEQNLTSEQNEETVDKLRESKKSKYKKLAGKAVEVDENIKELKSLSNREEAWRDEGS